MNIKPEQCQNLLALINRAQLQGNEAEAVVELKQILVEELKKNPPAPKVEKEEKEK